MSARRWASVAAGFGLVVCGLQSTERPRAVTRAGIRVDANLVLIPVSVTDANSHPVVGLDARRFRVYEGKSEQEVVSVSAYDDPLSVGIVLDASGSMAAKSDKAREAVEEFLRSAGPDDEFFFERFQSAVEMVTPFTANPGDIQNRLIFAETGGKTALLDAVHAALQEMKHARHAHKALLIISDGGDNASRYTELDAIGRALVSEPKVILLDEPSLGLAPLIVESIFGIVRRLKEERGQTVLLVEQNATIALELADYGYVMENGKIVLDGPAARLRENPEIREFYLGLNEVGARRSYRESRQRRRRRVLI